MSLPSLRLSRTVAVALALLLGAGGCGPKLYPVRGKVSLGDGKPVTEGMVVFERKGEEKPVTARGEIQPDGSFQLSTHRPGDGAPAGTYRVLVAPRSDPNAVDKPAKPPPFDPRYGDFKTSGLEFEVKAGGPSDFPITVNKKAR
ncbi:MAG TPA: hypothetical protein VFE78_37050 [Gemmataceae bacterium]|nr:hypothetical protein [Gemmataceae bacterium]